MPTEEGDLPEGDASNEAFKQIILISAISCSHDYESSVRFPFGERMVELAKNS